MDQPLRFIAMRMIVHILFLALVFVLAPQVSRADHHLRALDRFTFQRLGVDDGLSQGTINAIAQDQNGFMWFGTDDGLNRYDGYQFEVFRHVAGQDNTLSSGLIRALLVAPDNRLWVGTERGLNSVDLDNGIVTHWYNELLPADVRIASLSVDHDNILWIASEGHGLFSLHPGTGHVIQYGPTPGQGTSPGVNTVFADSHNRLWVSTVKGGVYTLDREMAKLKRFECDLLAGPEDPPAHISSMAEDKQGRIWLISSEGALASIDTDNLNTRIHPLDVFAGEGNYFFTDLYVREDNTLWISIMYGAGLMRYDPETGVSETFSVGEGKSQLLMNSFRSVYVDRDNNVWAGSNGMGINLLPAEQRPFLCMSGSGATDIQIPFTSVRGIFAESDREVYVSGYYGFARVDMHGGHVEPILGDRWAVFSFLRDKLNEEVFWIGTESEGLFRLDMGDGSLAQVNTAREKQGSQEDAIVGMYVYRLLQKDDGRLYVGTDRGLNIYDPDSETFQFFGHDPGDPGSIPDGYVISLYQDSSGSLWVGTTRGGMARFDPETSRFAPFLFSEASKGLNVSRVNVFYEDSRGWFWVGTNQGLIRVNFDDGGLHLLNTSDGLPNDVIYGILEDPTGQLWLSTNRGLSAYDPHTNSFRNFNRLDGLPGNEFNTGAYFQADPARLFFGGVEGLVAFDPCLILPSEWLPDPVITRINAYGREESLSTLFANQEKIVWEKGVHMMNFCFSGLNYTGPGKSTYAYRIEGLGNQWISMGDQRQITLARPRAGNYSFSVKATNSEGIWGHSPLEFQLQVLPLFYETRLFQALAVLFVASVIALIFVLRVRTINRQRRKLLALVRRQTSELSQSNKALRESNKAKDKFFSIIAHDLKNPFNALLGFSELLEEEWGDMAEDKKKEMVRIIRNTAESTYQLLLNLLDWSLLDRDQASFNPGSHQATDLIQQVLPQVSAQCEMKHIQVTMQLSHDLVPVWADADMVRTVLRNLLSNAIKFSHRDSEVLITADMAEGGMVKICIRDHGLGIAPGHLADLFKQKNISGNQKGDRDEEGTGLGLLLCDEFVRRNGGTIWAESEEGKGSTFCFTLPEAPLSRDD